MCKVAMSMLRNEKDCEDAMQTAILSAFKKLSTLKHENTSAHGSSADSR